MDKVWQESFKIRATETDFLGKLRLDAFFQMMQEAAGHSAESLGFGYHNIGEDQLYWVLSRVTVEFDQVPVWQDDVTLRTWPKGTKQAFALRDFMIHRINGDRLAKASSSWLVIDGKTERIRRRFDFPKHDQHALEEPPARIINGREMRPVFSKKAGISDLDVNNHVNNTRYVAWMTDALDYEFYRDHQLARFEINYLNAVKWNEEVTVRRSEFDESDSSLIVDVINNSSGKTAALARLQFCKPSPQFKEEE